MDCGGQAVTIMRDNLSQFLLQSERLLYQEPPKRSFWRWFLVFVLGVACVAPMVRADVGTLNMFLATLVVLAVLRVSSWDDRVEAAVTDRRVLFLSDPGEGFRFVEVALDDVAAVEIFGRAVRITTRIGRGVVLDRLYSGRQLAMALTQAAGVQLPQAFGSKERLADRVHGFMQLAGAAFAYAQMRDILEPLGFLPSFGYAVGAGLLGWLLGALAGLVLLRPYFTRDDMRAWMRLQPIFAPNPEPGSKPGLKARFSRWFVDRLYGQTGTPPDPGNAHSET